MESKGLSRRSFLKGSVVTGAALAGAAALAGCSTSADAAANPLAEIQKPENAIPENWDAETDIVVVGYGGAGMWASLIGADEGGSSVTVLEKAPVEGGGKQPHQQRRMDRHQGCRQVQGVLHGVLPGPDGREDDRRLHRRGRAPHRVRRQVRHDLRGGRAGAGGHHPRVLVPRRRRLRRHHRRGRRGGLRHDHLPRAGRQARGAGRRRAVRLPRRAPHPKPRHPRDRGRALHAGQRGEDDQGQEGRHPHLRRLRVQRRAEEQVPQDPPVQVRGLGVEHRRRHPHGRRGGRETVAHGHGHLHHRHVDARSRVRLRHLRLAPVRRVLQT